jgi:hypothetical protein
MEELIYIQSELKAPKNQYNAFGKYKYRSCEDILEAVKPLLKEKGCYLVLSDEVKEVAGIPYVDATAIFIKGSESVTVKAQAGIDPNRKGMDIAQSFGSSSSYARKYALNGLFLIDDTKDADSTNDHGKATQSAPSTAPSKPTVKKSLPVPKGERIKIEDGDELFLKVVKAVAEGKATIQQAIDKYSISEAVEDSLKEKIQALTEIV